ncbi:MAG: YgaP family membrane protein [Gammaproteobacteria bacterium]
MNIDRWVMRVAGFMVLFSLTLSVFASAWWLLLAAFVGANLFQASFTGFCPLASMLKKFGGKSLPAFK